MRLLVLAASAILLLGIVPAPGGVVSVAYAGSLVGVMEGPLKTAFEQTGVAFQGEGKGSKALANLMRDGDLNPDVFISADPWLYPGLNVFGHANLVVGYSPTSRFASELAQVAVGKATLASVLARPGFRLGRTDPKLDPKGEKTLVALRALRVPAGGPEQTFPEEELLTRVETGEADAGFFYSTEIGGSGLQAVVLPDRIGSRPGIVVDYAIVALATGPNPQAGRTFVDFVLHGPGKTILQEAGIRFGR